jgi:hypothetical protein
MKYGEIPEPNSYGSMEGNESFLMKHNIDIDIATLPQNVRENLENGLLKHVVSIEELIPSIRKEGLSSLNHYSKPEIEGGFSSIESPYSHNAVEYLAGLSEDSIKEFREAFKDVVIVDIGAGENLHGYQTACLLGAKGYIAVEPFNHGKLAENFIHDFMAERFKRTFMDNLKSRLGSGFDNLEVKEIPFNIAIEDGLSFLQRIPNNVVAVFTFGLGDKAAIYDDVYYEKMRKQLGRVIKPGTYYIQSNSMSLELPINKKLSEGDGATENEYIQIRKVINS